MKLFQLQYFVTVCQCGNNISRAAAELHISQPSISNAIRELEEEFGVALFQRLNRKLCITQEGESFLTMASELLARSQEVAAKMKDLGDRNNHIKVGVPPMIGTFLFPAIFQQFQKLHPGIRLEAFEHGSVEIMKMMEEDALDVAIVTLNQSSLDHFHLADILETEMMFCVGAGHPLAGRAAVSIPEIAGEPLVLLKGSYQRQMIESAIRACGVTPKVLLHTNQLYTISAFLERGIASAFLFREIAAMMPGAAAIPLSPPSPIRVGMVWKRGRYVYSDTARFINFVKGKSYLA